MDFPLRHNLIQVNDELDTLSETPEEPVMEDEEVEEDDPLKRRPGRPRKNPNATADEVFEEARRHAASVTKIKRCFDRLYKIADDDNVKPEVARQAAVDYINFTMGKPAQQEAPKKSEKPVLNFALPQVGAPVPAPRLVINDNPESETFGR